MVTEIGSSEIVNKFLTLDEKKIGVIKFFLVLSLELQNKVYHDFCKTFF